MEYSDIDLEVSLIDRSGSVSLEDAFSTSLDLKEEAMYAAVEDKNYVSDFSRKHAVPAGFDY